MKKFSLSLTLALILGGATLQTVLSPVSAAETKAQKAGRAALVAAYKQHDQAIIKEDVAPLVAYMAPDFQMYDSKGQVHNRTQAIAMMQSGLSGGELKIPIDFTKCSTRFLSLTWRGTDAIIVDETTSVAIARKAGHAVRIEQVSMGRDYWSLMPQGWKIHQTVEQAVKVWVNGKRVR